ncbi:2,3-bisphosphoglycerate-independent phosphoglycerate mutase [Patescibacteria group bacterium]
MKKIILIIIDGLGDRPIPKLGNKTPLEVAKTPNLDMLCKDGVCGLVEPFFNTVLPTSEECHFSLFGYNPKTYQVKRGFFTATGAGMKMKSGDVALRGNFGTVDKNLNMVDRRAGRIKETQLLIESLNGMNIDNVKILIKSAGDYRIGIILRGKNLSSRISDVDPFYSKIDKKVRKAVPLDKSFKAARTARVLNKFLKEAQQILENHPLNKKRKKKGLALANYILTRGASSLVELPGFKKKYGLKSCCIAGKLLYKQIGNALGMDLIEVKGADGSSKTNLKGKIQAVKKSLKKYDFIFLHIKAADSLAEDGNFKGKRDFIEKIDKNIKPLIGFKNTLIVVTGDHSTCSNLKRHCKELIPILIYGKDKDKVKEFSERACKKGGFGKIKQINLMPKILKLY